MRSVENSPSRQRSSRNLKKKTIGGMIFLPADNVESKCAILISAMISFEIPRPRDFKTKIGDQAMMHRIAREKNQPAERQPAFSTAQVIAMIRSVRKDVTPRFEIFRHQKRLHRVAYLAYNDAATQGARVERGNAEE